MNWYLLAESLCDLVILCEFAVNWSGSIVHDSWLSIFCVTSCGDSHFFVLWSEQVGAMTTIFDSVVDEKINNDFLGRLDSVVDVLCPGSESGRISLDPLSHAWAIRSGVTSDAAFVTVIYMISGRFGQVGVLSKFSNWWLLFQEVDRLLNSFWTFIRSNVSSTNFNNVSIELRESLL